MAEIAIPYRVDAALERGIEGCGLSREDALSLMEEGPLEALLATAAAVRDRFKGRSVSYSKKVFIPLTHLCRDYCGYCTFRADPQAGVQPYMLPDEVLAVAEAGRRAGCKEALFSLGDQPERVFPEAKEFLKKLGFDRTLDYLAAMSELVLEKTGLLPHSNPGLMGADDLRRLRETNVSVGLMLESASPRLLRVGGAHWKAPDKVPSLRIRTIENAGQLSMAFTTGILIGIGETPEERVDALLAIRSAHQKYGHIQEVIVQPFRAKPDIRMAAGAGAFHRGLGAHHRGRPIDFRRGDEYSVSAQFALGRLSRFAAGRHQRLGRNFSGNQGLHQSRGRLAANLFISSEIRGRWVRFARTAGDLSGICFQAGIRKRPPPAALAKTPGRRRLCSLKECENMLKPASLEWREIPWERALASGAS